VIVGQRRARGGTAEIWSLVDAPTRVAKVAHRRGRAEAALADEASALTALAATGVVPDHRTGELAGRPALLLERFDGPDLARWRPTDRGAALALLAALAEQVATLHDAGWIHGDLSPRNVIVVDADGGPRPRLIDFGAATPIGAPAPALATRGYLAPERLAPTIATAALDVYALGAIGVEVLTGRPAFGERGRAAALAHRDRRVPSLAAWVDAVGDDALRAALAKEPARRPTARALASALAAARPIDAPTPAAPIVTRRAPRLARGTRPPRAVAPPRPQAALVGRDDELTALTAALTTPTGAPRLITVLADAGLGKSALLAAAVAAAATPVLVLDGSRRLATVAAGLPRAGEVDDRAALAHALGGGDAPRSALAPGALRRAASRALAAALATTTAIVVDDGHAADPLLLDALELLAGEASWAGVVIVAGRPSLLQTRPRWGQRAPAATTLTLTPLAPGAAAALARALMPEVLAVPEQVLRRLVERAGGSPLVLGELIARLRATGRLTRDADGVATLATDGLDLPTDGDVVAWSVAGTLRQLPSALVAMAQAVAIAGPLPLATLRAVLDDPSLALTLDPTIALERLTRAGLLGGAAEPRFRHDLVRDAIAATAPPGLAAAIHRAVLRVGDRLSLAERAHHLTGAGDDAALAWCALTDDALARHDYLTAERAASAALAAGADLVSVRRARGRARARLGHHASALEDLDRAADAADGPTRAALLLEAATALDWLGRHRDAEARTTAAVAAAGPQPPPPVASGLDLARGRAAWRRREPIAARAALEQVLTMTPMLAPADRYEQELAARLMLGWILPGLGALDEAADHLARAEALASAHGDELHLAAVANNRYALHAAAGDEIAARRALADFTALARRLGLDATEYRGHYGQAIVAWWCEDHEAATTHAAAALGFERAAPTRFRRPRAALLLAALALGAGDRASATAHAAAARTAMTSALDEVGATGDRLTLTAIELALAAELDRDLVEPLAAAALDAGDPELAFELWTLAAQVAGAAGRRAEAAALAHRARTVSPALPTLIVNRRSRWESADA
jgi:predicted Ser/Thr protein kinase/tetratricopeptide (TPR) repeat protein